MMIRTRSSDTTLRAALPGINSLVYLSTYFSNFGTPGRAEDTNLKFCMLIDSKGY